MASRPLPPEPRSTRCRSSVFIRSIQCSGIIRGEGSGEWIPEHSLSACKSNQSCARSRYVELELIPRGMNGLGGGSASQSPIDTAIEGLAANLYSRLSFVTGCRHSLNTCTAVAVELKSYVAPRHLLFVDDDSPHYSIVTHRGPHFHVSRRRSLDRKDVGTMSRRLLKQQEPIVERMDRLERISRMIA